MARPHIAERLNELMEEEGDENGISLYKRAGYGTKKELVNAALREKLGLEKPSPINASQIYRTISNYNNTDILDLPDTTCSGNFDLDVKGSSTASSIDTSSRDVDIPTFPLDVGGVIREDILETYNDEESEFIAELFQVVNDRLDLNDVGELNSCQKFFYGDNGYKKIMKVKLRPKRYGIDVRFYEPGDSEWMHRLDVKMINEFRVAIKKDSNDTDDTSIKRVISHDRLFELTNNGINLILDEHKGETF